MSAKITLKFVARSALHSVFVEDFGWQRNSQDITVYAGDRDDICSAVSTRVPYERLPIAGRPAGQAIPPNQYVVAYEESILFSDKVGALTVDDVVRDATQRWGTSLKMVVLQCREDHIRLLCLLVPLDPGMRALKEFFPSYKKKVRKAAVSSNLRSASIRSCQDVVAIKTVHCFVRDRARIDLDTMDASRQSASCQSADLGPSFGVALNRESETSPERTAQYSGICSKPFLQRTSLDAYQPTVSDTSFGDRCTVQHLPTRRGSGGRPRGPPADRAGRPALNTVASTARDDARLGLDRR